MDEKERLLINDILDSCSEITEYEFTPYYIRKRRDNINASRRRIKTLVRRTAVIAAAAVTLLAAMGFYRITFINGFRLTNDRTFLQITDYLSENAPETIESYPYLCGSEFYSCTIISDSPETRTTEFKQGDDSFRLTQYTAEEYNEMMEHFDTSQLEYSPFHTGSKSGIFYRNGEMSYGFFQYGGYVFSVSFKGEASVLFEFIEMLELEDC